VLRDGTPLADANVEIALNTSAVSVRAEEDGTLVLRVRNGDDDVSLGAERVLTCSYSQMNELLVSSALRRIPLKHEITEIALVEPPAAVRDIGITVMCGPFFSTMPFPPRGLHSFTHVRYTPHTEWHDGKGDYRSPQEVLQHFPRKSNFIYMLKDAQRYMPILADTRYVDSLWEVKTVLPQTEADDGRPILFRRDHGLQNLTCIMGGKIDNIYDVFDALAPMVREPAWQ